MTLESLKLQRDALEKAVANDVQEVRRGDRTVRYKDHSEVEAALRQVRRDIAALEGSAVRRINPIYSKGF